MTFQTGDKVEYRYRRKNVEIVRKGVFVRYVHSEHANSDLCMVLFRMNKTPQYSMASGLTKLK